MKWSDMFQDPDMVGHIEYLAIHDAIAMSVLGTEEPDPDRVLTQKECQQIQNMLEEFQRVIGELHGGLDRKVVSIPTDTVDWALLCKQKAVLVQIMSARGTKSVPRKALEGIVELLDDIQDRAEGVLGRERVFGP